MPARTIQLVLHYDGAGFAGWQRQPSERTVQGVMEEALERLCGEPTAALAAGRTDAGVHARGQAVGVRTGERWTPQTLRRALNGILPRDVWIASAFEMRPEFHARFSATSRRYSYHIGTDEAARSPFRRRWQWAYGRPLEMGALQAAAGALAGEHRFTAFAVRGTARAHDQHRCTVHRAEWRAGDGGVIFEIEANRFMHHMVRFLVGTMVEIASGRRAPESLRRLLEASDNSEVAPPAPAHGLFLDHVGYPAHLYLEPAS
ncbi:MAG TPA: tRNA pseudouridine(38-40) synthase TruA [Gemmatimonadaceae bacterium]|nr:tRNA pseudouridine(38-40) synthase TruA [Gemmatimonadaceae bacterium]